jgi:hypothetical protein
MQREIKFTQFLMPDGRPISVSIARPLPIADLADAIVARGFRFECEVLHTREISLTITNDDDGDVAIEIAPNNSDVPLAVDRMVEKFAATLSKSQP